MTTQYSVEWDEPPEGGSLPPIRKRLQPLYDRPGEWARVHVANNLSAASVWASNLRNGGVAEIEAGEFETRHGERDGNFYVWARYIPEAERE